MLFNRSNFLLERTRSKRRIRNLINNASLIIVHRGRSEVVQYYSVSVLFDNWVWPVRMTVLCNVCRCNPPLVYLHSTHQPIFSPFALFSPPECALLILYCLLCMIFLFPLFLQSRGVFSPNFIIIIIIFTDIIPLDAYVYIGGMYILD